MKIIKRSGKEVDFDLNKIINAIVGANNDTVPGKQIRTQKEIEVIAESVEWQMESLPRAWSVEEIQNFIYIFFPFMFGIYPYTAVTEKQKVAMKEAGVNYVYQTAYELIYSCLIRLLSE